MAMNEKLRAELDQMLKTQPEIPTQQIVRHFRGIGVPKPTIYRWIARFKSTGSVEKKPRPRKVKDIVQDGLVKEISDDSNSMSECLIK